MRNTRSNLSHYKQNGDGNTWSNMHKNQGRISVRFVKKRYGGLQLR